MLTELHCHSVHSKQKKVYHEGINTPTEIVEHAKRIGIEALCLTDHDTMVGVKEALKAGKKHGILVIPSEEVTSKDGHILAIDINEEIEPGLSAQETIDIIHQQGGIAISPHAFDITRVGLEEKALLCDAMEIFNSLNLDRLTNIKCEKLAKKYNIPGVGGSDAHWLPMMGAALTQIEGSTKEELLKSIKQGRVRIVSPEYHRIKIILDWSLSRLQISQEYIEEYLQQYPPYKRLPYTHLLGLVDKHPGKMDYLFKAIAYTSLGFIIAYSGAREILKLY